MTDSIQKNIFSANLNNMLLVSKKTQKEVADAIGVSPQTFNTWCQGIALPRMGKLQALADYFGVKKSDLIEPPQIEKICYTSEDMLVARAYHDADEVDREMVRRILKLDKKESPSEEVSVG